MAPHGKETTPAVKELILKLSYEGYSPAKISKVTGKNQRTVSKIIQRWQMHDDDENNSGRGKVKSTSARSDRGLFRMVRKNRRQTLNDLTSRFNEMYGNNLSARTVRRRLFNEGYKRRRVSKATTISKINREKRREFCREKSGWTVNENWKKVIFSDETQVVVGQNKKLFIWRKDEEKYLPQCVGQYGDFERKNSISVMFWGCVCYSGVGTLLPVDGYMNTNKYINILDTCLWPVVARHFGNEPCIFQEDNAPCHANQWKENNEISYLSWPPQSPDLNIIENVWKKLKQLTEKRLEEIKCKADLIRVVREEWAGLTSDYIQSLYHTLPQRISAVRKAKRYISKY